MTGTAINVMSLASRKLSCAVQQHVPCHTWTRGKASVPAAAANHLGTSPRAAALFWCGSGSGRERGGFSLRRPLQSEAHGVRAILQRQPAAHLAQRLLEVAEAPARREARRLGRLHREVHRGVLLAE